VSQSYLLLWPQRRIDQLKKNGEVGQPFEVIYGSPHGSAPSLRRYGIEGGDHVYVVCLKAGVVYIVARIEVEKVISADEYFRDYLRLPARDLKLHLWDLEEKLARGRPQLGHRLPFGCVDEAAVVVSSSPIALDAKVPADVLAALRFRTKRGEERSLPLEQGLLRKLPALQGHFHRLTPETAPLLEGLVASHRRHEAGVGGSGGPRCRPRQPCQPSATAHGERRAPGGRGRGQLGAATDERGEHRTRPPAPPDPLTPGRGAPLPRSWRGGARASLDRRWRAGG
jgi:hypothetical protein